MLKELEKYLAEPNNKLDQIIGEKIREEKKQAASVKDEDKANYCWCLYQIFLVQKNYTDAFWNMKAKRYEKAWLQLDRADIELSFLEEHYEKYFNQPVGVRFQLIYILNAIKRFQLLFPYKLFMSREMIIKEEKCSICGEIIRLRGGCKHKLGHLYNGEQCFYKVIDSEFLGMALVTDPFDRYAYLKIEGQNFNYKVIDFIMGNLQYPYELWNVEKTRRANPEYKNIERNSICPCGSGKKFKKCCMGTTNEMIDHFIFDLPQNNGTNIKLSTMLMEI